MPGCSRSVIRRTPRSDSLSCMLRMAISLPGITRLEKITLSPAPRRMCGCEPSAMRERAARGSPWLPVQSSRTWSGGRWEAWASEMKPWESTSMPTCRAAAAMRIIERPTRQTFRPAARAAWMAVSMRATLEAKQATATRPVWAATTRTSSSRTSASEPARPSTKTLVESQTMARTPSSPSRRRAAASVTSPSRGSGSIFQSPVCSTTPRGVRMTRPLGSGMEWVRVTISTSNGPRTTRPPRGTSFSSTSSSRFRSRSFSRRRKAVKGVA